MITREEFEARVKAEAERECRVALCHERERSAHISARMKHEWPLVEVLQMWPDTFEQINDQKGFWPGEVDSFDEAVTNALAPYTTKPVEP